MRSASVNDEPIDKQGAGLPSIYIGLECGCTGHASLVSNMYQRGWPSYNYGALGLHGLMDWRTDCCCDAGGTNTLTLTTSRSYKRGNVCLSRIEITLVYLNQ